MKKKEINELLNQIISPAVNNALSNLIGDEVTEMVLDQIEIGDLNLTGFNGDKKELEELLSAKVYTTFEDGFYDLLCSYITDDIASDFIESLIDETKEALLELKP